MARLHLRFRDFHEDTLTATEALFDQKPWRLGTDQERAAVAQVWADILAGVYSVPPVTVLVGEQIEDDPQEMLDSLGAFEDEFGEEDDPLAFLSGTPREETPERITLSLDRWSLVSLFKRWREHMLRNGHSAQNRYGDDDVLGWAYSLFYKVKPTMFRARVREGRIPRVSPDDLLKTETIRARDEETARVAEQQRVARARQEMLDDDEEAEEENYEIGEAVEEAEPGEDVSVEISDNGVAHAIYAAMTRDQLRAEAAQKNIAGRGRMSKDELVAALVRAS